MTNIIRCTKSFYFCIVKNLSLTAYLLLFSCSSAKGGSKKVPVLKKPEQGTGQPSPSETAKKESSDLLSCLLANGLQKPDSTDAAVGTPTAFASAYQICRPNGSSDDFQKLMENAKIENDVNDRIWVVLSF